MSKKYWLSFIILSILLGFTLQPVISQTNTTSLSAALDNTSLAFTTGEDSNWVGQEKTFKVGGRLGSHMVS
jgi:hypothetical protein